MQTIVFHLPARLNPNPVGRITDRAKRYRAQKVIKGAKKCALCGRPALDVMHLDGNEDHGEQKNLAYGCRSCNVKLADGFKRIAAGNKTLLWLALHRQYNPGSGVPSFAQYAWAVSNHSRGSHDPGNRPWYPGLPHGIGGAIIHATPKSKRIEYAGRIAGIKASRRESVPF